MDTGPRVRAVHVFLAYAEGDDDFRDMLIREVRDSKLPAEFVYMPSKQPWVPRWKTACQERAFECHGAIVVISRRTQGAESISAELQAIQGAALPVLGVCMEPAPAPEALAEVRLIQWDRSEVAAFIRSLDGDSLAAGGSA
jgi:hypothetical protein